MPKFRIQHTTKYSYMEPVRDSANQVMLYPILDRHQEVLEQSLTITGNPPVDVHEDAYGNKVGTFTYTQPHQEMVINSALVVVTSPREMPTDDIPYELQWNEVKALGRQLDFIDFLKQERFGAMDEVKKIVEEERCRNCTPFVAARHFCQYVYDNFAYQKGITTVETTLDEVWKLKSGVCQDFAHMLLVMLRQMDMPARYVSGYICPNKNGMRGEGATHAWVEAYLPYYGWLGFDPTNNCVVNETHVRLAVGKNFLDCSPVKGTYRGTSDHTLDVTVAVAYEDGRTVSDDTHAEPSPATSSVYRNSFRKHQEMQMQQ